ncbi:fructose-bisphosphatase class II [Candidatus Daviesbacteria bacterium]|nr:fructose-bisphosphatase class II [Candidatus Daviesbacteria bacterium]
MDQVKKYITRATELTAISVSKLIYEQGFSKDDLLTEEESIKRERLIDQAGADAMYTALVDVQFVLRVVGSEGRKHIHQYGEKLPTLEGVFGKGDLKLDCVNDVVEGSKAAKLNSAGAVSVIAVGSENGLMGTPSDIDYMDKLFGPPQLKGKISLNKSVEENLAKVADTFKVEPHQINVVAMDRDRNAHYINGCQKFGVNLILIKAGDFMPSILSCMAPKNHQKGIHILMGIGGFEEGVMAVVAAKALGAACETRGWSGDSRIAKRYTKIWDVCDVVSGKVEDCLVSISAITHDKWFDLKGVRVNPSTHSINTQAFGSEAAQARRGRTEWNRSTTSLRTIGGHEVTTLTVDQSGVKIEKRLHH